MYYFSNILHSKHRIAGLDKDDMIIAMIVYALAAYVSVKTLIVMAPLFILYINSVVIPRDVIVVSKFAPIKVATTITAATENSLSITVT
jgi:hypothetical protein